MSLYPSLEDMQFSNMIQIHYDKMLNFGKEPETAPQSTPNTSMYPALGDYMGLEFSEEILALNMPEYSLAVKQTKETTPSGVNSQLVAPLSGACAEIQKAQVTNAIRQLVLCKDKNGKIGLRVKAINNGIFVCLVVDNSPAALAGLRFGDQILQINSKDVAGFTMDKVHNELRNSPVNGISIVVRDRPFERTITLHKDSTGHVGFQFKNGKIVNLVKDTSAARNGVLTEHQLLEVNGQNVVGLKDKEVTQIIDNAGQVICITVIPSFIYDHMIKKMSNSLLKNLMDHSVLTM